MITITVSLLIMCFIAGYWVIGDPSTDTGGVESDDPAEDLLPHQVRWSQVKGDGGWWNDPQLTVIGNININILCLNIDITTTEGAPPGYPENLIVKDKTGYRANLTGVYRRHGDSRVWKYGDFEFSFNGDFD